VSYTDFDRDRFVVPFMAALQLLAQSQLDSVDIKSMALGCRRSMGLASLAVFMKGDPALWASDWGG